MCTAAIECYTLATVFQKPTTTVVAANQNNFFE